MEDKGHFSINPIRFTNVEYLGTVGSGWFDFDFNLSKRITQNILYIIYHEPKTISYIAESLGVSLNIVEDDIYYLENNGFVDKVENNSFLTNILIHDLPVEVHRDKHFIYNKYAQILCEEYFIPYLGEIVDLSSKIKIFTPFNDKNFLLWTLISFICKHHFNIPEIEDDLKSFYNKRFDGSENIAYTTIDNFSLSSLLLEKDITLEKYVSSSELYMTYYQYDLPNLSVWQFNSFYDTRKQTFSRGLSVLYKQLYSLMKNEKKENLPSESNIKEMYNRGLILRKETKDPALEYDINVIMADSSINEILDALPAMPADFVKLNDKLSKEIYNISSSYYPKHISELNYAFQQKSISSNEILTRVIEHLLTIGLLKPLKERQLNTVNMIIFSDILPL